MEKILDPTCAFFLHYVHMKGCPVCCVCKVPENREKFFIYKERKEEKISMFKRLLLVVMLAVMLVSPGFAALVGCEDGSCIISCSNGSCQVKETQMCDASTLDVYSGNVTLKAKMVPHSYSCEPGEYLKITSESAGCATCESGYYCAGTENILFDGVSHGAVQCSADYPNSDVGATSSSNCYKIETVPCRFKNPYDGGNGLAVYAFEERTDADVVNGKVKCKTHSGQRSEDCELVDSSLCEIVRLECDAGYKQEEVNGEKVCVGVDMVRCVAGTYLKKGESNCSVCPEGAYCAGSGEDVFAVSSTEDQGIAYCEDNLKSPQGATSVKDCGYVLRVGEDRIFLHKDKRTSPSLRVDIEGEAWYANTTPISEGKKLLPSGRSFHVQTPTGEYTVHTALCEDEECE